MTVEQQLLGRLHEEGTTAPSAGSARREHDTADRVIED
ncbi:hypothetical protein SCANM63S_07157 [Streptomyces canarius]